MAADGPVKQEPSQRRIRGLLDGIWIFDTLDAHYVWEHQYCDFLRILPFVFAAFLRLTVLIDPFFYVPAAALVSGPSWLHRGDPDKNGAWIGSITLGGKEIEVAGFDKGSLKDLVKIPVPSIDGWYAEDEKLLGGHPKDPYKRIECLPSSREITIVANGVVVAQSTNNIHLHETSLRTRYYMLPTAIMDLTMLQPSKTSTFCPYKGQASYYNLKVKDQIIEDAIWYYTYPTAESAAIQGRMCFYNEKVEVYVDGKKEES